MVGALHDQIRRTGGFGGVASMSGAWQRDEAAGFVEDLFAAHHTEIYAYLIRMLRDPELAADLTQDAFIKAYRNYDTLEKPENARAWLYQIAHRVALDHIRRQKIVRFLPWTGESRGAAPSTGRLVRGNRRRRPDDWTTSHARARSDLSDRLDGVLDPGEARWLENHVADCTDCRALATAYEADRTALRGLREQQPLPPRDLWARTAAAIEQESRFRDHRVATERRRRARSSALAAALVVVVAAGVLTSSQLLGGGGRGVATPGPEVAAASNSSASRPADATSIPISQKAHWITETEAGRYAYTTMEVREVCPTDGEKCDAGAPPQDQPVQITTDPDTVFGSTDGTRLIVGSNSTVAVVPLASPPPAALGTPVPTASNAPSTAISGPASPSANATATGDA